MNGDLDTSSLVACLTLRRGDGAPTRAPSNIRAESSRIVGTVTILASTRNFNRRLDDLSLSSGVLEVTRHSLGTVLLSLRRWHKSWKSILASTGFADITALVPYRSYMRLASSFNRMDGRNLSSRQHKSSPRYQTSPRSEDAADPGRGSPSVDLQLVTGSPHRPRNLMEGLWAGVVGLCVEPINGLREGGVRGLVYGGISGSVGLVMKPLYGMLESSNAVIESGMSLLYQSSRGSNSQPFA